MIKFACSHCGQKIGVPETYAGKRVRCGGCRQAAEVPGVQGGSVPDKPKAIKFHCPSCNQKIAVRADSAGKQVRCAGCRQAVEVPAAGQGAAAAKPGIVKFRCPHCNQKIGVSAKYVGKHVRCAKCKQPLKVPGKPAAEEAVAAGGVGADVFGKAGGAGDILEGPAGTGAVGETLRVGPPEPLGTDVAQVQCPACRSMNYPDTEFCTTCGETIRAAASGARVAAIPAAAKVPLALGASLGFTLGGAIVWAIIASLVGLRWVNFLSVPVAGLAGAGLTICHERRNAALGLLAVLIGFVGIIFGKVFIAKWVVLPQVDQAVAEMNWEDTELTEEQIQWRMEDANEVFRAVCFQMAEEGEFQNEFAKKVVQTHYDGRAPLGEGEQIKAGIDRVKKELASWSVERKREAIEAQYKRDMELFRDFGKAMVGAVAEAAQEDANVGKGWRRTAIEANELMTGEKSLGETRIGFWIAFVGSFQLLDLLFFPFGLWTAYKIGAGRE